MITEHRCPQCDAGAEDVMQATDQLEDELRDTLQPTTDGTAR